MNKSRSAARISFNRFKDWDSGYVLCGRIACVQNLSSPKKSFCHRNWWILIHNLKSYTYYSFCMPSFLSARILNNWMKLCFINSIVFQQFYNNIHFKIYIRIFAPLFFASPPLFSYFFNPELNFSIQRRADNSIIRSYEFIIIMS